MQTAPITITDRNTLGVITDMLREAQHIFLAPHVVADGDCIGSALGLAWALRGMGKRVDLAFDDKVGEMYSFLPGWNEFKPLVPGDQQVFVYVDGSDRQRFGKTLDLAAIGDRPSINIDHHVTNDRFARINLVEVQAASTAEIVYDLVLALGAPLTPVIAQCLLTGVVTDTLGFRTPGTTADTLLKATRLVEAGGSIPEIVDRIYNRRTFNSLRLLGYAIEHARLDGEVIWSQVDRESLKQYGSNGNGTSGIVNTLLSVADARIAFFLTEKEDGRIDVGLRSRAGTDVSGIASRLGGGGHRQASGATLPPPFSTAAERVLAEIRKEHGSGETGPGK